MTKEQARWFRAASAAHQYASEPNFFLAVGVDDDADALIKQAYDLNDGWDYRDNGYLAVQIACEKAGLA
jgi:hypothetical protein